MKFGQLIEYNMRNIFLEKSYAKYRREAIPRPFSKKIKIEHISVLIMQSFFIQFSFTYAKLRAIKRY